MSNLQLQLLKESNTHVTLLLLVLELCVEGRKLLLGRGAQPFSLYCPMAAFCQHFLLHNVRRPMLGRTRKRLFAKLGAFCDILSLSNQVHKCCYSTYQVYLRSEILPVIIDLFQNRNPTIFNIIQWNDGSTERLSRRRMVQGLS